MLSHWSDLKKASPEFCLIGEERLHGRLAYLATVRSDGSPRVFPVGPFTDGVALWVFIGGRSPKRYDLINDRRYALHCSVEDDQGGSGEFHITGRALRVTDRATRKRAENVWPGSDPILPDYLLFELLISTALHTVYINGEPVRERWDSGSPD